MTDQPTDRNIISRIVAGDAEAFELLVQRYYRAVFATAWSQLKNRAAAEELTQEAFLRAYLKLATLKRPHYFPLWIHQITRNLATDWRRRGTRSSEVLKMVPLTSAVCEEAEDRRQRSALERLAELEEQRALEEAVERLPDELREVFLLRFVDDMPNAEIARRTGLVRSSVGRRIERALSLLRESFALDANGARIAVRPGAIARTSALALSVTALGEDARAALTAAVASTPAAPTWMTFATWNAVVPPVAAKVAVKVAVLIIAAGLLLWASVPTPAASQPATRDPAKPDPAVEQCLASYEHLLNKLEHVYLELESTAEAVGRYHPPYDSLNEKKSTKHFASTYATDGTRGALRSHFWGHDRGVLQPPSTRDRAQYESLIWRPDLQTQYNAAPAKPGTLHLAEDKAEIMKRTALIMEKHPGGPLMGYFGRYVAAERLDRVLRASQIRATRGTIDKQSAIRLSARSKHGVIDAYFGEQAPHPLLRLDCVKRPGDVYGNEKLPKDCLIELTIEFSDHRDFDGVAAPMQSKAVAHFTQPFKLYLHNEQSCRITKLDLAPDFEAMKAFELTDIREGATVHVAGRPELKHTWA